MADGEPRAISRPKRITGGTTALCSLLVLLLLNDVKAHDDVHKITQLSPKSINYNEPDDRYILETSADKLNIEPSLKALDNKDHNENVIEKTNINERATRSINDISSDNNVYDDFDSNDVEVHNRRKYYEHIQPTRTLSNFDGIDNDEDIFILSSKGFGDKIDFGISGEGQGVPRARALPLPGSLTATAIPRIDHPRQNEGDIQEIITGLVNILNGNVKVQANTQVPIRMQRPMASRINNRGPPRIENAQSLPDLPIINTLPATKIPPPYPFDRPSLVETPPKLEGPSRPYLNGVQLPEQLVPGTRPPYGRPWQRPRPRPYPSRRPPNNYYKPTVPPFTHEVSSEIVTTKTSEEVTDITTEIIPVTEEVNNNASVTVETVTQVHNITSPTVINITEYNVTVDLTTEKTKPIKSEITKESPKKKEIHDKEKNKIKQEKHDNKTVTESNSIEPSLEIVQTTNAVVTTPVEGLPDRIADNKSTVATAINTSPSPTPSSSYKPRPGIVLDDPDFKPHGQQKKDSPVIVAPSRVEPNYGEIFDVTVSAIQGPGHKGGASVHVQNVNPVTGLEDDIIVSASGDQGFVSIDGKRTYLNLFGESSTVHPSPVLDSPAATKPPPISPQSTQHPGRHHRPAVSKRPVQSVHGQRPFPPPPARKTLPTVRIDTCIVGDDSTCDQTQNERCKTEQGISSCHCRPGYARRVHRDPCRRVTALMFNMRVDKLYERKIVWDMKLADRESDAYLQLSYEALKAIDSAFSMTPYSDEFVGATINSIFKNDLSDTNGVYINYTVLMQENQQTLRQSIGVEIQKHLLGVIRRRSNNIGDSALWVDSPAGTISSLQDVDECSSPELNDCHKMASCFNTWGGFRCECMRSTKDKNPSRSGRDCETCPDTNCNNRGTCQYIDSQPYCSCQSGYYGSKCEVDGEVVGVAVGASLTALLVILLTLMALVTWSRKWSRDQKIGMGSPVFMASTLKAPGVGGPPYQVSMEERVRWAQIAEAMAHANHYGQPDPATTMGTRPSSAMFTNYPQINGTLAPVPMPRLGLHMGSTLRHNGAMNTLVSRVGTSHGNLYGYTAHHAESTSSEGDSHVQDRADLLGPHTQQRNMHHVPRPKSTTNQSIANQSGIYYDVDYENAPPAEAIYGTREIPLSTYSMSRGRPPYYRP